MSFGRLARSSATRVAHQTSMAERNQRLVSEKRANTNGECTYPKTKGNLSLMGLEIESCELA